MYGASFQASMVMQLRSPLFWDEELRYWGNWCPTLRDSVLDSCSRVKIYIDVTNISLTSIHTGQT